MPSLLRARSEAQNQAIRQSKLDCFGAPRLVAAALLLCLVSAVAFALNFPPLTGRVVDQANVMSPQSRSDLETKLKDLEDKSGIQLVVATVSSLQGSDVETYANELFRTWKLGQEKKNNGVLLLVAPNEHKVRIEVGYGLEGTLTDALSSVIISSAIVPRFKTGDFSGGRYRRRLRLIAGDFAANPPVRDALERLFWATDRWFTTDVVERDESKERVLELTEHIMEIL